MTIGFLKQRLKWGRAIAITSVNISHEEIDEEINESELSNDVVVQAPGWVEPEPFGVYASALADGVVKKVYVLEGGKS